MTEELRELRNNVQIVGLLKTKALEDKQTKSGKQAIMGHLVLEVQDGDNVQNIRVEIYAGKFKKDGTVSKLYTSDKTVLDEFKDVDTFGRENADYISVSGNLDGNDYINKNNVLVSTTRVRGVFMNREDPKQVQPHAWATVETIINGMTDIENEDGPTGDKSVEAYTIGYGPTVIQLQNVIIKSSIASEFEQLYFPGTMGLITLKINNYAVAREEDTETEAESHGFGSTNKVEEAVVHDFVNNLEIIGGEQPVDNGTEFTPEQIEEVVEQRKQQLAAANAPKTQQPTSGFGGVKESDIPNKKPAAQTKQASPFAGSPADDDFNAF